ncbi:MAG: hypothetical protein ABFD25_03055 [Clostridiaceae bacterium]
MKEGKNKEENVIAVKPIDEMIHSKRLEISEIESKELRSNFTKHILENPNYFGNFKSSKQKAAVMMDQNTSYEKIAEIGYNPYHEVLYSIIHIRNSNGYSGSLCNSGSNEYVRFYVDFSGDGDFADTNEDAGAASVNVHDIPGAKPLSYCVSVRLNPEMKPCVTPYTVKVRAILSWNAMPPANTPDYHPVWGEVQEAAIQIKPQPFKLIDFINYSKIKLDKDMKNILDIDQTVDKPIVYSKESLKELYKNFDVEEHRIGVNEVANQMEILSKDVNMAACDPGPYGIKIADSLKKSLQMVLSAPSNIRYEELRAVGLQYNTDTLTAVIRIKLPYGYSGGLCSKGSQEYVAFFADWNNDGTFDEYLGTSSVNVHDIPAIPEGGLEYAVSLPVNMAAKRKMCTVPNVFKIRAILSWNVLPPHNPFYNPIWGNYQDALVQLKPGLPVSAGEKVPFISTAGDMSVTDINSNGFANGTANLTGFQAKNSPFGGWVNISGHISNPPNLSAGDVNLKYCASYRKVGDLSWTKITNKFQITISQWDGYDWTQYHQDQAADSNGCYLYREDLSITPPADMTQRFVEDFVMAKWYTGGLQDGLYEIKLTLKDASGDIDSNIVRLQLDNTSPAAALTVTDVINSGVISPAKPCGVFKKNCIIKGKFTATDNHFLRYTFAVEPSILDPNAVSPASGYYPAVTGEENSDWKLDTAEMKACGYVIHLHVYDRTIVNSRDIGWYNKATVGFCLTE